MEIGKILEAFRFGTLQECRSVIRALEKNGISYEEFSNWLDEEAERTKDARTPPPMPDIPLPPVRRLRRKCPECESWLKILRVNDRPETMIGGDFKSQWLCTNRLCYWDEYSTRSVYEEAKSYIVEE